MGAGHPPAHDVRLRVRDGVAPPQRAPRGRDRRARGDPARPPDPVRRPARQGVPLPGAQGGVLPARLRPRPHDPRAARHHRQATHRRRPAHRPRGDALPSPRQPALRPARRRARGAAQRDARGHPQDRRAADPLLVSGAQERDRAGDGGRRPQPHRGGRLRDRGGRDDEPRSGRPRHARLHDVRRPSGRRRRAPDRRGAAATGVVGRRTCCSTKKDRRTAAAQTRDPQLFVDEILRVARLRARHARLGRVL